MSISLSPAQKALVQRLVASGRCRSETDAVNEAFRLLEEDEQFLEDLRHDLRTSLDEANAGDVAPFDQTLADLRHDLRTSLDEANAGDVAPFDQTLADQIKTDGRKALAERGHQDV